MRIAYLVLTTVLVGLVTPAPAQLPEVPPLAEESGELIDPIKRYTVELIIFAYSESVSAGTELWIPEEPAGRAVDAWRSEDDFDDSGYELMEIEPTASRRYMDPEPVLFGEDDYTMTGIYDKLVELEAYEPLVRAGWTQPTYEKDLTGPIALQTLAEVPSWLNGNLTLYLGRYLHLIVDLTMDADRQDSTSANDEVTAGLTFGDSRIQHTSDALDASGETVPPPLRYRIFEDRIVKNGDVRYFDHPKFGVIAKITRFEEPEEEIFDDTDDLLPGRL